MWNKSQKVGKDQEWIQQVPHLTQDTVWESDKNITYKRTKRSTFFQQVTSRLQETYMAYGKDKNK